MFFPQFTRDLCRNIRTRYEKDLGAAARRLLTIAARRIILALCALLACGSVSAAPAATIGTNETAALRLAIEDLQRTFPIKYRRGRDFLKRLDQWERNGQAGRASSERDFRALQSEALLANPLLNFDKLLLVQRADPGNENEHGLGLPQNWQGNDAMGGSFDNEIAVLSPVRPEGTLVPLYKPAKPAFVGDLDLHYDADRLLFSMPSTNQKPRAWHIWEIKADGTGLRQLTPDEPGVDHYDACYLPDDRIVFDSTAGYQGVPCVGGGNAVGNLYQMDANGGNIRQLCFDQDHNWCPTVMNDGRVMYTRWEYTDAAHYFSRILFAMNPDGTSQQAIYGSNSYWPTALFYARPIPSHPTMVVGVVSGHHGVPRMGELVLFDLAKGRHEADGVVQRIPGRGKKVEPIIADGLVQRSWPRFLHPYPLSEKYFLVSCKPTPASSWGVYLADVFDNLVLIQEKPGQALFEPVPLRKTPRPTAIPDRVVSGSKEATVYVTDVYAGPGLKGVPRGTVKSLRVFEYHYAYRHMGGHINIGVDGPWDVHRILGTVPVNEDGSAFFKAPVNRPLAVQPLDAEGRALQIMRSWFTAQPGERVSCVGCHESSGEAPLARSSQAARQKPVDITPWRGPARGFSFPRDVQPVLDKYCVGCHGAEAKAAPAGRTMPVFVAEKTMTELAAKKNKKPRRLAFDASYLMLHPYVRRPGPESDCHLYSPYEFHAETSELIQMLRKGHHGVQLDEEAWDRLYTWIDLNVPDHGTWGEHREVPRDAHAKRLEYRKKYANDDMDPEFIPLTPTNTPAFVPPPAAKPRQTKAVTVAGWPFDEAEAKRRRDAVGLPKAIKVELGGGVALEMALAPAGEFVMGDETGELDEQPTARVSIDKPFYMARYEIHNAQYRLFDPAHESGYALQTNKDHNNRGVDENRDRQPVLRVSWKEAMAFCAWLSKQTGRRFTLPTEAQWEWACRAGTATPLQYGEVMADFGKRANLADVRVNDLAIRESPKWIPCVSDVTDGAVATMEVGRYLPNAWDLFDLHGNAAEWTLSAYAPYPYNPADGRNDAKPEGLKVVRGGSFFDRPHRARSAFRLGYQPYQSVYNVGFRVVCDAEASAPEKK